MVRRTAVALCLVVAAAAMAAEQPSIVLLPDRSLAISLPERVLATDSVKRQLDSGLTSTFVVSALQPGTKTHRAIRTEIRWDLWDEVWLVRRVDADGHADAQRLSGRAALQRWWSAPVRFMPAADRGALHVELTVLPFSAAEEADARSWIGKAGGMANGGAPGGGIVEAMIGSTIAAQPITTMHWRIDIPSQ
jgi:hypothetical protein